MKLTTKLIQHLFFFFVLSFVTSCASIKTKHTIITPKQDSKKTAVKSGKNPKEIVSEPINIPGGAAGKSNTQPLVTPETPEIKDDFIFVKENATNAQFKPKIYEVVMTKLNKDQLFELADNSQYGYAQSYANFKLGEQQIQEKNSDYAIRYFEKASSYALSDDVDFKNRADSIIKELKSIKTVSPKTIGVVLPLSGKNATVGQRALRAVQLGLGLHLPDSAFKLAIIDSESNPDISRNAVERLVKEDNVIAIIGSLVSKTAFTEATKAQELGVPILGLSQKSGLTEVGPAIFRNSVTSEMLVRKLVKSAMTEKKMRRFAILYPNDSYGVEYANLFWDEVLARGGEVVSVQAYNPNGSDFNTPIQRLVGTYYVEAREEEYKLRKYEIAQQEKNKKKSIRETSAENILNPIQDFDAIFIPDSSKTLEKISAYLSYEGVKNVTLLGTNLWNTTSIGRRAGHFSNSLMFVDSPEINESSRFYQEYKNIYNEAPSSIEVQAYDSALILRQLIIQGASSRDQIVNRLNELSSFPGSLGQLNMTRSREVYRPINAYIVQEGSILPLNN